MPSGAHEMTGFNGTTLSYDLNGNLTGDGTNTYSWDARNHLSAITGANTASFVYDALGRRESKNINASVTQFVYDGLNPVQELDGANPANVTANLLTGLNIDENFTRADSNGGMDFLANALGSTLALTDSTGAINTSYTYEPFGSATVAGSNANPYQFTGREDDATGLYYYRARYYSPTYQRFIGQDPRMTIGALTVYAYAGSLNAYAYGLNDPANLTDPLGLFPIPWGLPINVLFGGGTCGLIGGVIGGAAGGILTDNPLGAVAGAAIGNSIGQGICNNPCAGALNCNEDQMLPPSPPPSSGPTCSEQHQ